MEDLKYFFDWNTWYIYNRYTYIYIRTHIFGPYIQNVNTSNIFNTYIINYIVFLFMQFQTFFCNSLLWNESISRVHGSLYVKANHFVFQIRYRSIFESLCSGTLIGKCARTERNLVNTIDTRTKLKRNSLTPSIEKGKSRCSQLPLSSLKLLTSRNVIERVCNFETTVLCRKKWHFFSDLLFLIIAIEITSDDFSNSIYIYIYLTFASADRTRIRMRQRRRRSRTRDRGVAGCPLCAAKLDCSTVNSRIIERRELN